MNSFLIRAIREIRGFFDLFPLRLGVLASWRSILLFVSLIIAGCGGGSSSDLMTKLPTTTMTIGGQPFVLEKAVTSGEQELGLMHRDSLPADHGMIFIYKQDESVPYWNHDVRFGLDNLFVDADGKIVSIQHMDAYDEHSTQPCTYRYVIELNAGVPAKLGLKVGDALALPGDTK